MPDEPLCLMTVHAHPDDESSKTAGSVALYSDEGARTVLVTCTGGEAGDVLNPAVQRPATEDEMTALRLEELSAATAILGYSAVRMLGYRDSGMLGSEDNDHPESFARADLEEATGRLVEIVREERPQVLIAYGDEHTFYPHPDHVRAHEIAVAAFDAAGDPDRFPQAGKPWQPLKLYYTAWSRALVEAWIKAFDAEEESPFAAWLEGRDFQDERFTTRIDVNEHFERRREALLAHRSQVDPESFWMRIRNEVLREIYPWEEYMLVRNLVAGYTVAGGAAKGEWETDLFAGVRVTEFQP